MRAWLRRMLAQVDAWPHGGTFPDLEDGDRQFEEYIALVRELVAERH